MADFINESGFEHGTVELASTLQHQLPQSKSAAELSERNAQVDLPLSAKQVRHLSGLEVRKIIIADAISNEQHNVITVHFAFVKS